MTMLEKVAKAIFEHGYTSDWPPVRPVDLNMDADYFRAAAHAAISAMREPTEAMLRPEVGILIKNSDAMGVPGAASYEGCVVAVSSIWTSMIDAALREKQ